MSEDLNAIASAFTADTSRFEELKQTRYEELVVQFLLTSYGITSATKYRLLDEAERCEGHKRLRLVDFCQEFPDFPLTLRARAFKSQQLGKTAAIHQLFNNATETCYVSCYQELLDDVLVQEDGRPLGLVFKLPYLKGNRLQRGGKAIREAGGSVGLVVHNYEAHREVTGLQLRVRFVRCEAVIETLSTLLRRINLVATGREHTRWSPVSP
jgi:hypothetical protein